MNAQLLAAASKVVPTSELLVNMVSRRVRQLTLGHRPLVETKPGTLASDIALTEIIDGKLTWQPAAAADEKPGDEKPADVVLFPGTVLSGKKAA